jgi:hypothetical protein
MASERTPRAAVVTVKWRAEPWHPFTQFHSSAFALVRSIGASTCDAMHQTTSSGGHRLHRPTRGTPWTALIRPNTCKNWSNTGHTRATAPAHHYLGPKLGEPGTAKTKKVVAKHFQRDGRVGDAVSLINFIEVHSLINSNLQRTILFHYFKAVTHQARPLCADNPCIST